MRLEVATREEELGVRVRLKSLPSDITRWLQPLQRSPVIPRGQKLTSDAQPCQGRIGILCTPSSIPLLIELKSTIVQHMLRTLL